MNLLVISRKSQLHFLTPSLKWLWFLLDSPGMRMWKPGSRMKAIITYSLVWCLSLKWSYFVWHSSIMDNTYVLGTSCLPLVSNRRMRWAAAGEVLQGWHRNSPYVAQFPLYSEQTLLIREALLLGKFLSQDPLQRNHKGSTLHWLMLVDGRRPICDPILSCFVVFQKSLEKSCSEKSVRVYF